jgi:CBS domain-containing protein
MNPGTELKSVGPIPRLVGEVMTREIKTLAPDQSFTDVVRLLAGNNFHHIVIAVNGYLMGMLSNRDVYRQLGRVSDWGAKKVGEIMITDALTTTPETLIRGGRANAVATS